MPNPYTEAEFPFNFFFTSEKLSSLENMKLKEIIL